MNTVIVDSIADCFPNIFIFIKQSQPQSGI